MNLIMTQHKQDQITLACWVIVATQFAEFQNPVRQYDTFSWDDFPDMMAELCQTSISLKVNYPRTRADEYVDFATTTGREIATTLVKRMTS